jgi:molybdenum cofactor cytidylyltransferase
VTPLVGVLLAAGRSRRMGRTKQLLPWPGGPTVVAAAFDAIAPACTAMIVVVGHDAEAVITALGERVFTAARADPDAQMFESLRAGVDVVEAKWPGAAVLVHPADHPAVARATLDAVVAAGRAAPAAAVRPRHGARGGHPVLLPPVMLGALRRDAGERGLRGFLADRPDEVHDVAVNDPGMTRDLDDENAYRQAIEATGKEKMG